MTDALADPGPVSVLVGGVGELYQGDLDLGRRVVERLADEELRQGVLVEELTYGAIAVTHRLEELTPDALVLVGAERRGRRPGTVARRRVGEIELTPDQLQLAVHDAGTGYVTIDLLVDVAWGFGCLPDRTVVVEIEPGLVGPSSELSPTGREALEAAVARTRLELERAPVLALADRLRTQVSESGLEPAPATEALEALLDALAGLDHEGVWGRTFAERDRLRGHISDGRVPVGMTHLGWSLWWALIEELDRLQAWEAARL